MREMSSFRRRFVVVGTMADSFRHCFATFYQMSYNDDDDDEVCLSPTLGSGPSRECIYRMQKREFPVRPFPILSRVSGAAVNAAERIRETPFALLCSLHPRTRTTSDREEQEKGESDVWLRMGRARNPKPGSILGTETRA